MPYESLPPKTERAHSVNIEGREKMKIQGVDDVSGFDENMVVLCSSQGDITVRGQGLHIERIDLDAGCLELHSGAELRRTRAERRLLVEAVRLRWR